MTTPATSTDSRGDGLSLRARLEGVQRRVADAARKTGRQPGDILIVAVTKYAAPEQIRELLTLGHGDFAENRVQSLAKRVAMMDEFSARHQMMADHGGAKVPSRIRWHMIGHLQRNKVKQAVDVVNLIHSVDSLRVAEEIQEAAVRKDKPVEVLLQVNASNEPQKHGVALPAALHLAEQIESMPNMRLRGLMAMGPLTDDQALITDAFERARDCFDEIRKAGSNAKNFDILSMGMSSDFELAIAAGANLVRIGSAIFGPPSPEMLEAERQSAASDR